MTHIIACSGSLYFFTDAVFLTVDVLTKKRTKDYTAIILCPFDFEAKKMFYAKLLNASPSFS